MYRVLLVDDEIWSLKGLESSFEWEEEGFSVMERTTSSTEAMKFIEAERPDAVFTDIRMPELSGLDLLRNAREQGIESEFIIISGYAQFDYAQEAVKNGAFDYCLKPIDLAYSRQLLQRLREKLDQNRYRKDAAIFQRLFYEEQLPESMEVFRNTGCLQCIAVLGEEIPFRLWEGIRESFCTGFPSVVLSPGPGRRIILSGCPEEGSGLDGVPLRELRRAGAYVGISRVSKAFEEIITTAEQDLRDLMNIPDNYKVLFLQGGASQQFAMIPMNLMKNRVADYIITGQWAKKAAKEAEKYGKVNRVASSEDKTFSYIPDCSDLPISEDADYVYICENNTIYGTKFKELPNTKGKTLVADVSSCFLSEPVDVTKYGLIYGGVQKNIGPAGVVIVIIREDLITEDVLPGTPTMLTYKTHADAKSLYNTPPAYGIYICGKVFKWLKAMGGLSVMKERNEKKAKVLYDFLDQSKLFKGTVEKKDRSLMNVPFVTGDADLDAKFVKEAKEAGLENLKGHRTVGGMRASIYNAMPYEGVVALVDFMKKFEEENL